MKKKNLFSYIRAILGRPEKHTNSIEVQLSRESIKELKARIIILMNDQKPFLQPGYHMKDMADDLRIQPYQLSAFINQVMGVHFTDYINKYRINHCEVLMKSDPDMRQNLKELAYKCGFNNRNSFAAAFKKFTGFSPSDYIKQL